MVLDAINTADINYIIKTKFSKKVCILLAVRQPTLRL